jgi:hypothetical protein
MTVTFVKFTDDWKLIDGRVIIVSIDSGWVELKLKQIRCLSDLLLKADKYSNGIEWCCSICHADINVIFLLILFFHSLIIEDNTQVKFWVLEALIVIKIFAFVRRKHCRAISLAFWFWK